MENISAILKASVGKISVGDLLSAVIVLVICLAVVRPLLKLTRKVLSRTRMDHRIQKLVASGIRALLYVLTAIIVAGSLGVDMTSLVALLSVFSLGVTLAAEDILANVAGGLVILSAHPFAIGDYIEVSGAAGTVDEVTMNYTKLVTPNGQLVMLPNKSMAASQLTNYTALGRRRITWKISVSYKTPTETVKAACHQAIAAVENILEDPVPAVYLSDYGSSGIEFTVYCWAPVDSFWSAHFALGERLREELAAASVEITYDHLNVHIQEK